MGSMLNFAGVYNIVWTIYKYIYISHMLHVLKGQFIGYDALLKDNFHAHALETAKANHGHRLSQQSRHS